MKIALYQNNPQFGQIKENTDQVLHDIRNSRLDILVLPELFATGYQFHNRQEARSLSETSGQGYVYNAVRDFSAEKDCLVIYGFPESARDKLYNSALAMFPDGHHLVYRKTHLFDTEKQIFNPGDTGFFVFQFKTARLGIMICFDWRFPESARRLSLLGAQLICHPSNLVMPHGPESLKTRALENGVFIVTSDRVGDENRTGQELHFIGKSRIIGPSGEVLGEMGETQTGLLMVDLDPQLADNKQITPNNNLFADRRPGFY